MRYNEVMSTSYSTTEIVPLSRLESILAEAGLELADPVDGGSRDVHRLVRTDTGVVHVYLHEEDGETRFCDFERFGLNDPSHLVEVLEEAGIGVLSEHDDGFWDLPQNRDED
jgi:hypothetical protein